MDGTLPSLEQTAHRLRAFSPCLRKRSRGYRRWNVILLSTSSPLEYPDDTSRLVYADFLDESTRKGVGFRSGAEFHEDYDEETAEPAG
jgi:uncharacterized protein (TIGR02996 family)